MEAKQRRGFCHPKMCFTVSNPKITRRVVNRSIFTCLRDVRAAIFPVAAGTSHPSSPPPLSAPRRRTEWYTGVWKINSRRQKKNDSAHQNLPIPYCRQHVIAVHGRINIFNLHDYIWKATFLQCIDNLFSFESLILSVLRGHWDYIFIFYLCYLSNSSCSERLESEQGVF